MKIVGRSAGMSACMPLTLALQEINRTAVERGAASSTFCVVSGVRARGASRDACLCTRHLYTGPAVYQ